MGAIKFSLVRNDRDKYKLPNKNNKIIFKHERISQMCGLYKNHGYFFVNVVARASRCCSYILYALSLKVADARHGAGNWLTFAVHVRLNGPPGKVYTSPISETMAPLTPAIPVHVYVGLYPFAVQVNSSPAPSVPEDGVMVTTVGQPADTVEFNLQINVRMMLALQSSVALPLNRSYQI